MRSLSVAVILGDNYCAGLSTLSSLINQSLKPDQLVVIENPLRNVRLSERFPHFSSLLAYADRLGIDTLFVPTQGLSIVNARIRAESLMTKELLMISDGDHFYPVDYLERAVDSFGSSGRGFFGGAVECLASLEGFDSGNAQALVRSADDYVAGGSFVYDRSLAGLWRSVLEYTNAYGEDRAWRALAFKNGASRIGTYEGLIAHLSTHSHTKYGEQGSAAFITLCRTHLGKPIVPRF